MQTLTDTLAAAIARGLGFIAAAIETWRAELVAEIERNRAAAATVPPPLPTAAARRAPPPPPAPPVPVRRPRPVPPPVPVFFVNGRPAYVVARS